MKRTKSPESRAEQPIAKLAKTEKELQEEQTKQINHNKERIGQLIKQLHGKEQEASKKQFGNKSTASLAHSDYPTNQISKEHRRLDSLARLLEPDPNGCAAVCYYRDKLIIAKNDNDLEFPKQYMEALTQYARDFDLPALYAKLQGISGDYFSVTYNYCLELLDKQYYISLKATENPALAPMFEAIDNFVNNWSPEVFEDLKTKCYEVLYLQGIPESYRNLASNILRPYLDFYKIIREINPAYYSAYTASPYACIIPLIVEAIKNPESAAEKHLLYLEEGTRLHAEMKVSEHLAEVQSAETATSPNPLNYIGISNLTCCLCNVALETFKNIIMTTSSTVSIGSSCSSSTQPYDTSHQICRGTHGTTYETWEPPAYLLNNQSACDYFCNKLQSLIDTPNIQRKGPTQSRISISPPDSPVEAAPQQHNVSP